MTLAHLSVGKKFVLLVCAVVLGFGVFGALTYRTMNRIKVSGPLYAEIITGKDIVADILPPPEYIIESYLTAHLMSTSTDEAELRGLQKKLGALRKEYEARQTYWKDHVPEGPMGELLLKRSSTPARVFYTLVDTRLLPLVREGNTREAMALMRGDVRRAYEEHRAAIDELVTLANTHSKTSEENAAAELRFGWVLLGTAAAGMLTVVVLLNAVVARSVTIPLRSLEARLKDIAQGEGDLTKRVEIQRRDEIGLAASWFNTFVDRIERLVSEVKSGAALIGAGGTQIADASQSLAEGASEQAGSLSAISASLEKMSHQTQLSAGSAREASSLAQESKKSADRGCQEMTHMSRAVSEIKESSARISKIIHVIDEIAFQTNLLALNAAVEAARAGEAGKGFAVVAEEVRNLAQRSAAAAKDTSAMIEESVKRSDNGVQIAQRVGAALEEITSTTGKVNSLLAEIAGATSEQATGIAQVTEGVTQLDVVTQQNAANSEELASSADQMSVQLGSLRGLVGQFKASEPAGGEPSPARRLAPRHAESPAKAPVAKSPTALADAPRDEEVLASF